MWRMKREKAGLGCDADLTLVKGKRGASRGGWREPQTVSILHIVLDNIMGGGDGGLQNRLPIRGVLHWAERLQPPLVNFQFAKETSVGPLRAQQWAGLSHRVLHLAQVSSFEICLSVPQSPPLPNV